MANKNQLNANEVSQTTASATNGSAIATITAPTPTSQNTAYITGIIITASGAVAAAVEATLTNIAGSGTFTLEIPAATFAPLYFAFGTHPLKVTAAQNCVATLPALGAGIKGTITVLYFNGAL